MTRQKELLTLLILSLICSQGQCFIGNNIFKTKNPDLFEHFCVETGDGLEEIGQTTSTHESITIQGIKRSVMALFADLEPGYEPPSEDSTLSEIFQ